MGRQLLLTDKVREIICEAVAVGCPQAAAAQCAGINPRTLSQWLRFGRKDDAEGCYKQLVAEIELARGRREKALLARVYVAASKPQHWQAAAWLLTAINPGTYGRHAVEVRSLRAELAEMRETMAGLFARLGGENPFAGKGKAKGKGKEE